MKDARDRQGLAAGAVFTFMQHPRQLLDHSDDPFLLTTWREKLSLFEELGCQVIVAVDFCPALARLGYREFVELFLVRYLGMKHLVAGYDVHLGADRQGTARPLATLGQEMGFTMEVVPPVREGQTIISSSVIRQAVSSGDMRGAAAMLGRPYALWGEVVPGDGRGRTIGFPTANIQSLDGRKLLPEPGVYAARVQVPGDVVTAHCQGPLARVKESLPEVDLQGELLSSAASDWVVFPAMLNFGYVPTFHRQGLLEPRIEAHLLGFQGGPARPEREGGLGGPPAGRAPVRRGGRAGGAAGQGPGRDLPGAGVLSLGEGTRDRFLKPSPAAPAARAA